MEALTASKAEAPALQEAAKEARENLGLPLGCEAGCLGREAKEGAEGSGGEVDVETDLARQEEERALSSWERERDPPPPLLIGRREGRGDPVAGAGLALLEWVGEEEETSDLLMTLEDRGVAEGERGADNL